MSDHSDYVIEK
uniref:Uncharacterized protein n=1 Tax=Moniliophthora roreri TaxID=221103 RepID=A0A0W0G1C1_MONRR